MKKRNHLIILVSIFALFSCNNINKEKQKMSPESSIKIVNPIRDSIAEKSDSNSYNNQKDNDTLLETSYFFSNDNLCQTLIIEEISKSQKFKIPKEIKYKLVLHDKQQKFEDKIFNGIAQLSSSEESFFDKTEIDGGSYDAADYNFETKQYKLKIRLDIQSFEACVVLIITSQPEIILSGFANNIKEFPNEGVMKRGECK